MENILSIYFPLNYSGSLPVISKSLYIQQMQLPVPEHQYHQPQQRGIPCLMKERGTRGDLEAAMSLYKCCSRLGEEAHSLLLNFKGCSSWTFFWLVITEVSGCIAGYLECLTAGLVGWSGLWSPGLKDTTVLGIFCWERERDFSFKKCNDEGLLWWVVTKVESLLQEKLKEWL